MLVCVTTTATAKAPHLVNLYTISVGATASGRSIASPVPAPNGPNALTSTVARLSPPPPQARP